MTTANTLAGLVNSSSQVVVPSGGIQFVDATNASGSTVSNQSNLIEQDGYEEGDWTATYVANSGSFTTMTMSNVSSAKYVKVGKVVTVQGLIRTSDVSIGTASGNLYLSGLPFTPAVWGSCAITEAATWGGDFPLSGFTQQGNSSLILKYKTSVNGAESYMNVTDLATGSGVKNVLVFSATYRVA